MDNTAAYHDTLPEESPKRILVFGDAPQEPDTNSSYFLPNYPPDYPVFYIPEMPDIMRVPEPAPHKKPPPQGYDMKTLRKQLEFYTQVCM